VIKWSFTKIFDGIFVKHEMESGFYFVLTEMVVAALTRRQCFICAPKLALFLALNLLQREHIMPRFLVSVLPTVRRLRTGSSMESNLSVNCLVIALIKSSISSFLLAKSQYSFLRLSKSSIDSS